jgi:hypothetical protein
MASRFGAHLKLWFFVAPLLAVLVMPALPDTDLFTLDSVETASVASALGSDRANEVMLHANARFRTWFLDSGLVKKSLENTARGEVARIDGGISSFAETWTRHFWQLIFRAIYRATALGSWMWGLVIFLIAMSVDGSVMRKIKASAAGFASPLSFHLAWHGLFLLFGGTLCLLFLPLPMIVTFVSWAVLLAGGLAWKAASSFRSSGT